MAVIPLTLEDVKHVRTGYFRLSILISHETGAKSTRNQKRNLCPVSVLALVLFAVLKKAKPKAKQYEMAHGVRVLSDRCLEADRKNYGRIWKDF